MRIAALATVLFLAFAVLAPAAAARPTAIVAMGDSFISGEGGRWLGNGSDPFGDRSGTDRAAYDCGALGLQLRRGTHLRVHFHVDVDRGPTFGARPQVPTSWRSSHDATGWRWSS